MSVHVLSWVLRESTAELGDRLVLLVLADHAREDGTSAWPSLETIAHQSRLSERQARRCLRNLEASGEIVETGRSRKGTHIYSFPKYRGDNMTPQGGTSATSGGDNMTPDPLVVHPSGTSMATPPPPEPKVKARDHERRRRNDLWDALSELFGEPTTRTAQTGRGKVCASLAAAGATPQDIYERAKRWALHYDHATLTEHALEKHWDTLPRKPLRRSR